MALGRGPCDTTRTIKKPGIETVFQWIKARSDSGFEKWCISDEIGGSSDEEKDENTGSECERVRQMIGMMNRVKLLKRNTG
jgi:hypothetical protein